MLIEELMLFMVLKMTIKKICEIYRLPVVSMDVYSDYNVVEKCITSDNEIMVLNGDGCLGKLYEIKHFLGLEFDGIKEDWKDYIDIHNITHKKGDKKNV